MDYLRSPFNYHGNKYKLLPQLIPLFPKDINMFCDVFGGGFTVGINVEARYIIYNDIIVEMVKTLEHIRKSSHVQFIAGVEKLIKLYGLNKTNKEGYLALRREYNAGFKRPVVFYTLLCFSFNNLVRFSPDGDFNAAFGLNRSDFTASMRESLIEMSSKMKKGHYGVTNYHFTDFPVKTLHTSDLVYCDPPYLITDADYNKFWNQQQEYQLLRWLDKLNERGIRFGLSNVMRCKGKLNHILHKWSEKYNVHAFSMNYANSSYARIDKEEKTEEVYICNYNIKEN